MRFEQKLQIRIALGYVVMLVVGISMIAIMLHERKRIHKIEARTEEIRQVSRDINTAHRRITRLALLGESVINWNEEDRRHYHVQSLHTDSLLQALLPHCTAYVHTAQIDTLRTLLVEKETHLLHIMEAVERHGGRQP